MMRGVTLVELVLTLGIFFLLIAAGVLALSHMRNASSLNVAAEEGLSKLLEARARTLSSEDASRYGVYFAARKIVLFKGDTYVEGVPTNKEYILPADVEISAVELAGGGNAVVFQRLSGVTAHYGTTTLRLVSGTTTKQFLIIEQGGSVYRK